MKKLLIILSAVMVIALVAVGCANSAADEKKDEMMDKPAMTEAPKAEMTEEPMDKATEEPMAKETEKPMTEATEEPMEEKMMIGTKTEAGYIDITVEEAQKLIESTPELVIIDVSPKYDQGHIPGSINFYVGNGDLDNAIPTLDKSVPYLVYCHVDSASISGSKKLVEAGFEPVYRLIGNYGAWVAAGLPVE